MHINVPLSEPLFEYTVKKLPKERVITLWESTFGSAEPFVDEFTAAKRPMIVVGQVDEQTSIDTLDYLELLADRAIIIHEALNGYDELFGIDLVLNAIEGVDKKYVPDFVLHIGGEVVSKRLKSFLQRAETMWRISPNGEIADTYKNITNVISGDTVDTLKMIAVGYKMRNLKTPFSIQTYYDLWYNALEKADQHIINYEPAYSQAAAVKAFEEQYYYSDYAPHIHYANSTSIRLANLFARHYVWCNRGINGIEGCVSTAVGFAMAVPKTERLVLVTGDLAFFYDSNALWNEALPANIGILLLNNGEGGIFRQVKGFGDNPMAQGFHHATAEGICHQNGVTYVAIHNIDELYQQIERLTDEEAPIVMEVFTDAEIDKQEFNNIYNSFKL